MSKIRFGKDLQVTWPILTNGEATSLVGRDLTLLLKFPCGKSVKLEYSIQETNKLVFKFLGTQHEDIGMHSLTLWENLGKVGQTCIDKRQAFELVATTEEEDDTSDGLDITAVNLTSSSLIMGLPGVGITNIQQTVVSEQSEGVNILTITLSNGQTYTAQLKNGTILSNADKAAIASVKNIKESIYGKEYGELELNYTNGAYYDLIEGVFGLKTGDDIVGQYCKIDVSEYIGKAIKLTMTGNPLSARLSAIGNEDASTIDKYVCERDMSLGCKFVVTEQCHFLYVSCRPDSVVKAIVVDIYDNSIESSLLKTLYVSPTGNDANEGYSLDKAKATVSAALAAGANNILLASGTYKETIDMQYAHGKSVRISKAEPKGQVLFTTGTAKIIATAATKTSGYTKVYQAANTRNVRLSTGRKWIFQEGVADAATTISASEIHPLQQGRVYRCEKETLIVCCDATNRNDALAEIENADAYKYWWDETNGIIYFSCPQAPSNDHPITSDFGMKLFTNANESVSLKVTGIDCCYVTFNLDYMSDVEVTDCSSRNVCDAGAFTYNYCSNVKFVRCEASRAFCGTNGANGDGFNGHCEDANQTIAKDRATCTLIDCWAHDNNDDGYSDHERSETSLYGGLYEYNGKAGVTPSYGSHCSCYNVYSRCNYEGFMYTGAGTYDGGASGSLICYNCIAENNNRGEGNSIQHSGYRCTTQASNSVRLINCVSINNAIGIKCDLGKIIAYNPSIVNCTKDKEGSVDVYTNVQALPSDVVRDASYVHTDNNYSDAEKAKVNSALQSLPADVVQDASYQHTDNNYSNEDKSAVQNIGSLSTQISAKQDALSAQQLANINADHSKYLTSHQSLANYYTKSEIDTTIGNINTILEAI